MPRPPTPHRPPPPPPRPVTASSQTHVGHSAGSGPVSGGRAERNGVTRGRRVLIHFGPGKAWEAVYWGQDDQGAVVAHRTHNRWSLMHLDLARFRDTMEVGEELDAEEIADVERDLAAAKS